MLFIEKTVNKVKLHLITFQDNFKTIIVSCSLNDSQPAITCSKVTIETLEQSVKYAQS